MEKSNAEKLHDAELRRVVAEADMAEIEVRIRKAELAAMQQAVSKK